MALREPSIIERHIGTHVVPWGIALGIFGALVVALGVGYLRSDPLFGVLEITLGVWIAAGPWMSRRLVRRWDAGER